MAIQHLNQMTDALILWHYHRAFKSSEHQISHVYFNKFAINAPVCDITHLRMNYHDLLHTHTYDFASGDFKLLSQFRAPYTGTMTVGKYDDFSPVWVMLENGSYFGTLRDGQEPPYWLRAIASREKPKNLRELLLSVNRSSIKTALRLDMFEYA